MKRFAALPLVGLLTALAATAQPTATQPVVEGNTKFATDLYKHLSGEKGNLFLSPYSISSALAMTYQGARGETAKEMKKTLAFPADDTLNAGFLALNDQINGDPNKKRGYQLAVANALWGQEKYPWKKDFLDATGKFYGAGVKDVDFKGATEKARLTINGWVEDKTNQKIKDLLKPGVLTVDTRLVLTNAIYFKGDWQTQFKKDQTRDQDFRLTADKTAKVPMMHMTARFAYGADADVQVLRLPYTGKELELVAILPKKVDGLAEVEKKLSPETLKAWIDRTRETKVEVALPKFKVESEFALKPVLSKMGMPTAFTPGADLSGIAAGEPLKIADVIHKAFVDVNEEGTEAAAATAVIVEATSAVIDQPRFIADHPFLFLIRDTRNGSILFLGRLAEPVK